MSLRKVNVFFDQEEIEEGPTLLSFWRGDMRDCRSVGGGGKPRN